MPQLKVLLVDEQENVRAVTRQKLQELGDVAIIEVSNVEDAKLALATERPPVVITEIVFRQSWRTGMGFVGETRKAYPSVVIVVLTTKDERGMPDTALRIGATAFVSKMSRVPNELEDTVREYIPHQ